MLLDGPLGLAGQRCMATLCFASGERLARTRREQLLEAARAVLDQHALKPLAGATSPHAQLVLVRVLAPVVEPAMELLRAVWAAWRTAAWQLPATPPRLWAM